MATTKATTLAHTLGGISSDISTAELNRLDGVTGDLQTQLDAKLATTTASSTYAPLASPTFTSSIKLTPGSAPGSPAEGMIYYNSTDDLLYLRGPSSWSVVGKGYKATGGTISTSGSYTYHTFTSSGTFIVGPATLSVDYLIVAGGGGGGSSVVGAGGGGGGGAGGLLQGTSFTVNAYSNYTFVIGAGGAGGSANSGQVGNNGANSTALGLTAIGGGGGDAGNASGSAQDGGSGGGVGYNNYNLDNSVGQGTTNQGYNGGAITGAQGHPRGGGGGGSAGSGSNNTTIPPTGGAGTDWQSLGTTYASGGAGGTGTGSSGTANRGNGGDGGYGNAGTGSGGSGIVIVRYLT